PAKAADGKRLHRLEPDPETAPVVHRIYHEYLSGIGVFAIAQRLTAEDIPCPRPRGTTCFRPFCAALLTTSGQSPSPTGGCTRPIQRTRAWNRVLQTLLITNARDQTARRLAEHWVDINRNHPARKRVENLLSRARRS
ncbi:MAG TPA: recombinase family protein, partial [Pseudonocardiaceae bacterium]|nr:recombinase family protein [Pseudonocardiaceae bacterium]